MQWLLVLLCTYPVFANESGETKLSANQYSALYGSMVGNIKWQRYAKGWYIFLNGDDEEGMAIFHWPDTGKLEKIYHTDARDGFSSISRIAVSNNGQKIYFQPYINPTMYQFYPGKRKLVRFRVVNSADTLGFWKNDLFKGAVFPENHITVIPEDSSSSLKGVQERLPPEAKHPMDGYTNVNQMITSVFQEKLALGYSLYQKVFIFDGQKVSEISAQFPGYLEPPRSRNKNPDKYREWVADFHRLCGLSWLNGNIFGLYRRGFDDLGLWINLSEPSLEQRWDNNRNEWKIVAIHRDYLMMAKPNETEDDLVWALERRKSFPTP